MLAALRSIFRKRAPLVVRETYIALVAQARKPFFYETLGVPDSLDGRFGMIVVHMYLLQDRLRGDAQAFAQYLSEVFFEDMDNSLREFGVGDTGIKHRIKKMGRAYHACLQHYATDDREHLKAALSRNLYGTVAQGNPKHLGEMADYIGRQKAALKATETSLITSGNYAWPA